MRLSLLPTLATCVLAQALPTPAAAQFAPDLAGGYVDSRLSNRPLQQSVTGFSYTELDSVAYFSLDDEGRATRTGRAIVEVSDDGEALLIGQLVDDLDGTVTTDSVAALLATPADGDLRVEVIERVYDGVSVNQNSFLHVGTFAAGSLQRSEIQSRSSNDFFSVSVTDILEYDYDAEGRPTTQVSSFLLGTQLFREDSTVIAYGDDGRISQTVNYAYGEDAYEEQQTLTYAFVDEGHIRVTASSAGDGGDGTFVYRFSGGVLDSFLVFFGAAEEPSLGIYRADDRQTDNIRTYDYFFGGPSGREIYYLNGATSQVPGAPQIGGEIVAANPTRPGAVIRYDGDLPAGARWRLTSVNGRVIETRPVTERYVLPALAPGIYIVSATAPGYAELGRVLVVE